jgi:hypothetical protein
MIRKFKRNKPPAAKPEIINQMLELELQEQDPEV